MARRLKIEEPSVENWADLSEEDRLTAVKLWPQWYQSNIDSKILRAYFFEYAEKVLPKDEYKLLRTGTPWITDMDGALARIIMRGFDCAVYIDRLCDRRIPAIVSYVRERDAKAARLNEVLGVKDVAKGEVYKPSIQERIAEQARHQIGVLEGEIDAFLANKCKKPKFDMTAFLRKNDVKGPHTKLVIEFLERNLDELKELLKGQDLQLIEGYSFLSKPQRKKYYDFLRTMADAAEEWQTQLKKSRKPRKKKVKTAAQQTGKLNFLDACDEYGGLKSIPAKDIVGARQVWLFNTKDRFLHVYNSDYGLSVKGSTINDFDEDMSFRKKLRKPEKIIPDVLTGGKVKLRKIMSDINAKEAKVTGRVNNHTIILRAVR